MSKQIASSLFTDSSLPRLYNYLLCGIETHHELGNRVIERIKAAHAFRQVGTVQELSRVLINIPIKENQLIGRYYRVWCKYREGEHDVEELERIFEQTQTYKPKALFTRGGIEWYKGNSEAAFSFYLEAMKTLPSVSDYIVLSRSIAVMKATEGFHKSSLMDLENLLQIIKYAEPLVYYDFLNSYALELIVAGRKEEARNIARVVLASPFSHAYPEWQRTADEVKEASRSHVVISAQKPASRNVLPMPVAEPPSSESVSEPNRLARVLNIEDWKSKMGSEAPLDEKDYKGPQEMNESQMIYRIINLFTDSETSEQKRLEMCEAIEKIAARPDTIEPNDTPGV